MLQCGLAYCAIALSREPGCRGADRASCHLRPVVISDQSRASAAALLGSAWIKPNWEATIERFAALPRRAACDDFVPQQTDSVSKLDTEKALRVHDTHRQLCFV